MEEKTRGYAEIKEAQTKRMTWRLSESDYQSLLRKQGKLPDFPIKRKLKWNHVVCEEDGWKFDSLSERDEYRDLKLRLYAKQISKLQVHPLYIFVVNGEKIGTYEADFSYQENSKLVVVDVKNPANSKDRSFRRNCKLMLMLYGIVVVVVIRKRRLS